MPQLSRRHLLSLVPAAGALTTPRPTAVASAANTAEVARGPADLPRLLANTVATCAGTAESNARPEVAGKLATVESAARNRLALMDSAGPGELFAGGPLGAADANLQRWYLNLYEIALASRTPGIPLDAARACSTASPGCTRPASADEGVKVRQVAGGTLLTVHTRQSYGASFAARLIR